MELRFNNIAHTIAFYLRKHKHTVVVSISILLGAIFIALLTSGDASGSTKPTIETITTTTIPRVESRPVSRVDATTTTTTIAVTTTTINPVNVVNSLTYTYNDPVPAMMAFREVAKQRGWSPDQIETWAPFAEKVMKRESGYCYNLRRGGIVSTKPGCEMIKVGPYQDSGFGQLIRIHYNPGKWLCEQENLCSPEDITSTPWNSMTAFVALIERNGRQPWCYTASLRSQSSCKNAPKDPPAI
jgi:multisubunit Na+/H+ antiporter MnhC subunit